MSGKLTPLQLETLAKIERGEVYEANAGYGAWRIRGASPTVVGLLIRKLGLAAWRDYDRDANRRPCALTEAGRKALEAGRG